MLKPRVICHMASSVDGRIISENWGDGREAYVKLYEDCHNSFNSDAWLVGRVTMEKDFTEGLAPEPIKAPKPILRIPFVGNNEADSFAVAIDAKGKLGWERNDIDGDHVISVLTEAVSDDYLHYLQSRNVSYIFAGKDEVDFNKALEQLHEYFKIETVMLEGGGNVNGGLLAAGVIDELSLLVLPLADGSHGAPTVFELSEDISRNAATRLHLIDVQKLAEDAVWLKYGFK